LGASITDIRLLSIGTGTPTRDKHQGDKMGEASQNWGPLGWIGHGLIDHFFSGNSTTVEYLCSQVLADGFVRVNGFLDGASDDLDDVSAGNINNLMRLGQRWYRDHGSRALDLLGQKTRKRRR
jgi:hypothetical protein